MEHKPKPIIINQYLIVLFILFFSTNVLSVEIYENFPNDIRSNERYVIYSHGLIVEGTNPRPTHPKFGVYEFANIKQALFEKGGFNLIAHHRPKDTDIDSYVEILESWVRRLVVAGVKPSRITLVGFSRGSHLTVFASNKLRDLKIHTALLGSCSEGDIPGEPALNLQGNLLSIYETTDVMGSCKKLAARSTLTSFKEVSIATGLTHGAFFTPLSEWLVPLKKWISETNR